MILGSWTSLRFRLTRKLVLWQLVMLVAFALVASIPFSKFNSGVGLDDRVVWAIADSIEMRDRRAVLDPSDELTRLEAEYPNFWYYARTAGGQVFEAGPVPGVFRPALENLGFISFGDFGSEDFPELASLIVRQAGSEAGPLHVATGGGPRFPGLSLGLLLANKYFVGISAALSLMMIILIPLTLRRALRGLDQVAQEASHIDIDQRGMRLSDGDLPIEIQPLVRAFNEALARLDEGIERRHRFMADAAHELRTPIAILQTRVELLPASSEREQLLLDVARLSNLADQLLDLQRIDVGHPRFETLNLVQLGADATSDMAPLAIASNDEIAFESPSDAVWVRGDHVALSRTLINLIQNAIAHAGAAVQITVRVAENGTVTVEDNGSGIPAEQRGLIFDPFYRVKPGMRGAGLGLNLVREVVLRHHGTIKVDESPMGGAAFSIALPLAPAPSA